MFKVHFHIILRGAESTLPSPMPAPMMSDKLINERDISFFYLLPRHSRHAEGRSFLFKGYNKIYSNLSGKYNQTKTHSRDSLLGYGLK